MADAPGKPKPTYDAASINVLGDIEAVRARPGMYVGDTGVRGLHHLVFEVVDNSVDEAMAGECTQIQVTIHADGSASVVDNGRGIPVDIHKEEGRSALEVVMTTLHAGGKFDSKAYSVSSGLHGVGVSAVCALSEWMEAEVWRDGHEHVQRYARGKPDGPVQRRGRTDRRGTRVTFKPDPLIFKETTTFVTETLAKRLRELAFLVKGLSISILDERTGKQDAFRYEGGVAQLVSYVNQGKKPLHPEVIHLERLVEATFVEVAMQYNESYNEAFYAFANSIHTHDGGTHLTGFRTALTRTLNQAARDLELLGEKETLPTGDDYREGLTAVVNVRLPNPQFESQTKVKLTNTDVEGIVISVVGDELKHHLERHPSTARAIIQKAMQAARAREAAREARELVRKTALASGSLPGKLADCSSRSRESTELFIVEGDSAGGSAKQGRDRRFQAILPLKGKILNVQKARVDKMLRHEEIRTLITAVGTGLGEDDFDLSRLRYGKVIILCDADVDGSHIRTLLMTFFFWHLRPLIEAGHLYLAQPPLFRVQRGKSVQYVHSDLELTRALIRLGLEGARLRRGDRTLASAELAALVEQLLRLEQAAAFLGRMRLSPPQYFARLDPAGRGLPRFLLRRGREERYFFSDPELSAFLAETGKRERVEFDIYTDEADVPERPAREPLIVTELHEAAEAAGALEAARAAGFGPEALFGEEGAAAAVLEAEGQEAPVVSARDLVRRLRRFGQQGLEVQRFKGLGEMNPEQLWETTMDPARRTLLRVTIEDAIEAERMFGILMGDEVEPRRKFIEKHALEVKFLDV
jgi:DNA gyrase subunit B